MEKEKGIHFEQPEKERGYNSHGYFTNFRDIVETEQERGNEPFLSFSEEEVSRYGHCRAIWVTHNPHQAFRYALMASEAEQSDATLEAVYPAWREEITEIDCRSFQKVVGSEDGDDGYLLVEVKKRE